MPAVQHKLPENDVQMFFSAAKLVVELIAGYSGGKRKEAVYGKKNVCEHRAPACMRDEPNPSQLCEAVLVSGLMPLSSTS